MLLFVLLNSNYVDVYWFFFFCFFFRNWFNVSSIWKEVDGSYWCRVRWYMIPEETSVGRQPHNLSRELYQTNDFADIEVLDDNCFVC